MRRVGGGVDRHVSCGRVGRLRVFGVSFGLFGGIVVVGDESIDHIGLASGVRESARLEQLLELDHLQFVVVDRRVAFAVLVVAFALFLARVRLDGNRNRLARRRIRRAVCNFLICCSTAN